MRRGGEAGAETERGGGRAYSTLARVGGVGAGADEGGWREGGGGRAADARRRDVGGLGDGQGGECAVHGMFGEQGVGGTDSTARGTVAGGRIQGAADGRLSEVAMRMQQRLLQDIRVGQARRLLIDYQGAKGVVMPDYGVINQRA
ncbi:hypothetical protein B1218_36285, partial [Pseudomonas ogarae]